MAKKARSEVAETFTKPVDEQVRFWVGEVEAALKRERAYRKEARGLIEVYEAEEGEGSDIPFNILFSNTETLAPALYSQPPRPDSQPRSKVENPVATAGAGLVDAYLTTFIDSGDARYLDFHTAINGAVLHALVPGRGLVRLHYKAKVERNEAQEPTKLLDESVFLEQLDWDKVAFGYAKTWAAVPWVAFIHTFTKEEAEEELGAEVAGKLTYERPKNPDDESESRSTSEETATVATLYEIWHRQSKKVLWVEACGKDTFVKAPFADPYQLEQFYPIPEPLQFFQRISCFIPVPLYRLYKQQAQELNRITRRITKLIEAMKIRGFYDSNVEGLEKIFESEENTLVALTSLAALGQGAKAENAIWLVPIEKYVVVLQQLILQRQQIKTVIYEIMGIADIMRGSTMASETLGAQELKNKWGTLRLKRGQNAVANFIRNTLRLAAELGLSKLSDETIRQMTGSSLPRQAEMDQIEQQIQLGGQAPPPEVQAKMALPTFEEALTLCRTDILRRYLIDIETNSTIDADASEDKTDMGEFFNALSQFLNGLVPLLEKGLMPMEVLKATLMAMAKRFRLGRELSPALLQIGQGQPQGAAANEQARKQLEEQGKQLAEGQKKIQAESEKVAKEQQKLAKDRMAFELAQAQAQMQAAIKELQSQMKDAKAKAQLDSMLLKIQAATERMTLAAQAPEKEEASESNKED